MGRSGEKQWTEVQRIRAGTKSRREAERFTHHCQGVHAQLLGRVHDRDEGVREGGREAAARGGRDGGSHAGERCPPHLGRRVRAQPQQQAGHRVARACSAGAGAEEWEPR